MTTDDKRWLSRDNTIRKTLCPKIREAAQIAPQPRLKPRKLILCGRKTIKTKEKGKTMSRLTHLQWLGKN